MSLLSIKWRGWLLTLGLVVLASLMLPTARAESDWIGQIVAGQDVVQYFRADEDNLLAISLVFGTYNRANSCTLRLSLTKAATGRTVTERNYPCATIADGQEFVLDFPAQAASKGQEYYLTLSSPDARPGNALTTPAKTLVGYQSSPMLFGGKTSNTSLYLKLVYGQSLWPNLGLVAGLIALVTVGGVWLYRRR